MVQQHLLDLIIHLISQTCTIHRRLLSPSLALRTAMTAVEDKCLRCAIIPQDNTAMLA